MTHLAPSPLRVRLELFYCVHYSACVRAAKSSHGASTCAHTRDGEFSRLAWESSNGFAMALAWQRGRSDRAIGVEEA